MFDWENAIALHAMQGNRSSSRGEGEVSAIYKMENVELLEIIMFSLFTFKLLKC